MAYGNIYADTLTNSNGQVITTSPMGFKNRIINGDMRIDQRNAGAAVTASGAFPVDRFYVNNSTDGAFSAQQDSSAPVGFVNSVKYTVTTADASLTTTQATFVRQIIEGTNISDLAWGTVNAKTVTLSFWVRSSLTGTFGGSLANSAFNRSYPFTYTISSVDTWEQKSITIAGDTTGTWLTTTGIGIQVSFSLGAGPDRIGTAGAWNSSTNTGATGQTQLISTLNATFYITGVQLEVGSSASSFDYRPYGTELALCQRYFWVMTAAQGTAAASDTARFNVSHPWMRGAPAVTATAALKVTDESTADYTQSAANIGVQANNASGGRYTAGNFTGMTANRAANLLTTNGAIQFSAEL